MDDRSGDGPGQGQGGGGGARGRRGPEGTEWLDLEISRVLHARAEAMARGAAEELIRDAIKARMRERVGPRLEAIGRGAADALADGMEASLDIEARIAAYASTLRERATRGGGAEVAPPTAPSAPGEGADPQKP